MSEPNSASDPTPPVPPAPSFSYGSEATPPPPAPAAPPAYGQPAYGAPVYGAPQGPRRRTWDVVLTIILLVVGLFGAGIGVAYGLIFLTPELLGDALVQAGYGQPAIDSRGPGTVIIISHAVLYLIALGVGIALLLAKKIAFWVPLAAGVVAAIVFWVVAAQVFLSIPGFAGY